MGAAGAKSNFGGHCQIEGPATRYVNSESKFTNCDADATTLAPIDQFPNLASIIIDELQEDDCGVYVEH